jgi:hypothetical protein
MMLASYPPEFVTFLEEHGIRVTPEKAAEPGVEIDATAFQKGGP